jgi:arylsulfatase A-like enzyme
LFEPLLATLTDADVEFLKALYDAEIRSADREIGRFLDQLAARGLLENSIVIVTSDHGEEFPGTRFELALIGPKLDEPDPDPDPADSPLTLRARTGLYRRALWSELGRPDLVIGYHCGLHLYPTWKPTILELRGSGVPFVLTSYRSWEAEAEARLLIAVGATRVHGPTPNRFASLASRQSTTIANDVAHDNEWVSVWR